MSIRTTPYVNIATAVDGVKKRTVEDRTRNLFPGSARLTALIATGQMEAGKMKTSKGLISKAKADTNKVEVFVKLPLAVVFTASAALSTLTQTFASTEGLIAKMCLFNTRTNLVCRVDTVTNSTTILIDKIDTAFDVANGDVLIALATAYEEYSADPAYIQKDPTNIYNTTQIHRFPTTISASAMNTSTYGTDGGSMFDANQQTSLLQSNRILENSLLFSQRAASGEKTTGTGTNTSPFGSMRGMWNYAQSTYDVGGSLTAEDFQTTVAEQMHDSVADTDRVIMLCGNVRYGRMLQWIQDKLTVENTAVDKELKRFGVKSTTFMTSRFDVSVIKHNAFDLGGNTSKAMLFVPDNWTYYFLKNRDFKISRNIQSPSADGKQNEIIGEACLLPKDGGYSTMTLTGWDA